MNRRFARGYRLYADFASKLEIILQITVFVNENFVIYDSVYNFVIYDYRQFTS